MLVQNFLPIEPNHIDLWFINPNDYKNNPMTNEFFSILDENEVERVGKFLMEDSRHDSLITRAFVRTLLSYYTDGAAYVAPSDWQFKKGHKGKPEIVCPPLPLKFNLSHTDGLIVCAVALRVDLGVDVEFIHRKTRFLNIAKHKFAPTEIANLESTPERYQRSRFFDYWTLKESYIKAIGLGLSVPLDDFYFDIKDYEDIDIHFTGSLNDKTENWQSWLTDASDQHRLALSIHCSKSRVWQRRIFKNYPLEGFKPLQLPLLLADDN